ncbi:MAG: Mini-ribonuclease 3 [Butyrivibrio sp.]
MFESMKNTFGLPDVNVSDYSPLTLAYIGDCVYELIIRTGLVYKGNAPVNKLNADASRYAKAGTQSAMIEKIMDSLSEEELSVYKRGRNAHSYTKAKNATSGDYRRATGFEALIGYLYLEQKFDRIMELVRMGFDAVGGKL